MFLLLLLITFCVALLTSVIVIQFFRKPTLAIFTRVIGDDIAAAWHRFLLFAFYVVGVSSGVRLWELEKYIAPATAEKPVPVLDSNRWWFEVYSTVISTLGGLAWALLVFFVVALIAFALVRRRAGKPGENQPGAAA
jgi:hypothetical protein